MRFPSGHRFVSVVIPALNEAEPIAAVVREVAAQGVDEIIVVDNGSSDGTADEAARAGARVVHEPIAGYGRACAAGLRALSPQSEIVCFLDGDGSDVPSFLPDVVGPVAAGQADFVLGSRRRGRREPGSLTPQQVLAARLAGLLLRLTYGVRFTDMSPFRALPVERLRALHMQERTYGWNLEMQMRVAAAGWRILEVPVDHRRRRGGSSKVSGNLIAAGRASWTIMTTFVRLALVLRRQRSTLASDRGAKGS
jgi:glycosyltransferase involved in cell wall biosynthesis